MNKSRVAIFALAALLGVCSSPRELLLAEGQRRASPNHSDLSCRSRCLLLGDFHLTAKLKGREYELEAKGRFSFISGMIYRASGKTESNGKLSTAGVEPSRFTVTYKGGSKREERRLSFADGAVDDVSIVPRKKPNPRSVPVTLISLNTCSIP